MNTRTSKLIFPAILFLFACLIAFGENGPTPQIIVGSSGISDGSVTNAKLAEPVSVANGGTGKTTAAEALAALGGASLNGSSTVNFLTEDLNVAGVATFTGFVKLGDAATGVKMKVLTGTTGVVDSSVTVNHGVTSSKIIGFQAMVFTDGNTGWLPNTYLPANLTYSVYFDSSKFTVFTDASGTSVAEKPFTIILWYTE